MQQRARLFETGAKLRCFHLVLCPETTSELFSPRMETRWRMHKKTKRGGEADCEAKRIKVHSETRQPANDESKKLNVSKEKAEKEKRGDKIRNRLARKNYNRKARAPQLIAKEIFNFPINICFKQNRNRVRSLFILGSE